MAVACGDICGHVLLFQKKQPSLYAEMALALQEQVGHSELGILTKFIRVLQELLEVKQEAATNKEDSSTSEVMLGSTEIRHRCVFAFQRFFRVVATFFHPILVLDDLQWADSGSLDLFEVILQDQENSNLLVVGSFRSNVEVDDAHIFTRARKEWRVSKQNFKVYECILTTCR